MDTKPEVTSGEEPVEQSVAEAPVVRKPPKPLVWLVLLGVFAAGGYWQRDAVLNVIGKARANSSETKGGRGGRGGRPETLVRFAHVERIPIQRQVELSGTLAALDQARVSSEVAGIIKDLNMELGQEVMAGQVLIQLDTRELELARARAESALRQIEAQLGIDGRSAQANGVSPTLPPDEQVAAVRTATANRDDARAQFRRAEELNSKGLIPRADHETAQTRLKVAEAALQSALENVHASKATIEDRRASYQLAQKKLEDATIRAPMSGSISERLVSRGEFIRENAQIATIVQTSKLKLRTAVQERYATQIRPGLRVQFRVESYPDRMFEGTIINISPSIDQATRTFPVEVLVDNPQNRLKPGFFATGAILTHRDAAVLAAPEEAVSVLAGVSSVYIVEDGAVRQQSVTLGVQEGKFYEIIEGLQGNETLAASNLSQLVSGDKVAEAKTEPNTTTPPNAENTRGGGERGRGERGERGRGERGRGGQQ